MWLQFFYLLFWLRAGFRFYKKRIFRLLCPLVPSPIHHGKSTWPSQSARHWNGSSGFCSEPFDSGKWFIIGFCAWLAQLGEGGWRENYNNLASIMEFRGQLPSRVGPRRGSRSGNLNWIVPLAAALVGDWSGVMAGLFMAQQPRQVHVSALCGPGQSRSGGTLA